ncbi:MAG: serine hydroxymethyltransferase [Thermoprotei archaeon]
MPSEAMRYVEEARRIVSEQNDWRGKMTLNLIASENVMSQGAASLYNSDFEHRYAEGEINERYYEGTKYVDQIEALLEEALRKLFKCTYVNFKPVSGAQANLAVFYAYAKPGDSVMSLDVPSGGHISYREFGAAGCRGLTVHDIPFDPYKLEVVLDELRGKVRTAKEKLRIVTLGGSLFLFPHPVREIATILREEAPDQDVVIHYDAAHVLGLIAGGVFQDPLREGAQVVSSSTHKTFPGPQGGLILGEGLTDRKVSAIRKAVFPGLVSNHHLHRLPALLYVTAEMLEFGREYAAQTVRNAKRLAKALDELGFKVLGREKGYTESHQVAFDASTIGGGSYVASKLAEANIIVNKNLLPGENSKNSKNPSGIRIGVQEITRFGMKEEEMERIAHMMADVILNKTEPSRVAEDVYRLRADFPIIVYTFDAHHSQHRV